MANVLEALIYASERAACVARSCVGSTVETLVVTEKCEGEANTRFERDFKTIADVLAQESAKTEIVLRCPELAEHVRGEECANINGVCIKLQDTLDKTVQSLISLMPQAAAQKMAEAAHSDKLSHYQNIPTDFPEINIADLGVWIDPIDATAEFIAGVRGEAEDEHGLTCVTVLIGAYRRSTGEPVVGVINQPFFNNGKGRIVWGVNYNGFQKFSASILEANLYSNIILMSGSETSEIVEKFKTSGWEVKFVPGAGHKLLKVALGEAAAYLVSKGTTFRWDTCAPHSLLRALGGDLLCCRTFKPITYNDPSNIDTQQYCNSGGIIAYNKSSVLDKIKNILN